MYSLDDILTILANEQVLIHDNKIEIFIEPSNNATNYITDHN